MRRPTLNYLKTESGAGLILVAAAALAVAVANSREADRYFALIATPIPVQVGGFAETLTLAGWVQRGLMPVFFLVLGMQMKFEMLRGELSNPRRLAFPALAAAGGLAVPALLFLALTGGQEPLAKIWPAAAATDVSVALAMLALAGPRLPSSLRILLMSVAIADDLAVAALRAVLHRHDLVWPMAVGAAGSLAGLMALSRWPRAPFLFYAVGFVLVWAFALKAGLDTSLAGFACALTVPIGARRLGQESVLKFFMDSLHPYVAFAVLPLFAFTAAGFSLRDLTLAQAAGALPLAIAAALWLGKPLGVFGISGLAAVFKLARRPTGAGWAEILGVAMLSGVGLTVSLFFAAVASGGAPARAEAATRLAVAAGSLLSALSGATLISWAQRRRSEKGEDVSG